MKFNKSVAIAFVSLVFSLYANDFSISKLHFENQYYGLPLSSKIGYLYRKNNYSIFPYVGLHFDVPENYSLRTLGGISFDSQYCSIVGEVAYELMPALLHKNNNIYEVKLSFDFPIFKNTILSVPVYYGNKELLLLNNEEKDVKSFIACEIKINSFLLDTGRIRGTFDTSLHLSFIPSENFYWYEYTLNIPVTVYAKYFDFGFKYSMFYNNELALFNSQTQCYFDITKTYSSINARPYFSASQDKFKCVHSIELEDRFYFLRFCNPFSSFFVSAFGNVGLGIKENNDLKLLYQYGVGVGYTLFDSVPFTVQGGFDQDKNFVLFLGVVSKIAHKP